MQASRLGFWVAGALVWASCGGISEEGQGAKTPDEILEEQERLGAEQEKKSAENEYTGEVGETDMEKKEKWDAKQVDLEIKRAVRSAETCPGSVTEAAPKGSAKVSLTFGNDGHVKASSITAPYTDTAVGACVLRAMAAVIVPAYEGNEESIEVDVDLTGKAEEEAAKEKAAKEKEKTAKGGKAKPAPKEKPKPEE
jgi:hypothetical protein